MMKEENTSTNNAFHLEEIIRVPWGSPEGIPEAFVMKPQTSMLTSKVPGQMRASLRIRVAPWRSISVLASNPTRGYETQVALYTFSQKGQLLGHVEVRPPTPGQSEWQIVDFLTDEVGYIYLLETARDRDGEQNVLRKLTPQGETVWERSGPVSRVALDLAAFKGTFHQLLIDEQSNLYLPATQHTGLVTRIDPLNGKFNPYADWGDWTGEVYVDGKGTLHYVRYLPKERKQSWTSYDPRMQKEHLNLCDENLSTLSIPIAADSQGRGYAVMGMDITCISSKCSLLWQEHIDNIVVDEAKNSMYSSVCTLTDSHAEIHIQKRATSGESRGDIRLTIPPHLIKTSGTWRLIYTDTEERYYVYGGETSTQYGTLVVYSSSRNIEDIVNPAPDVHLREYRLQPPRTWSVDLEGNMYLPLLGSTSFHFIKLSHI